MVGTVKKALAQPTGKFPADDPKTYRLLFDSICSEYELETAMDQAASNRMATTLMRIHY